MSRIGKKPIVIPDGVDVTIEGQTIRVKGPKGELLENIHPHIKAEWKDKKIHLKPQDAEDPKQKALWGLHGALIKNMIQGVTVGFSKTLEINGIGFRAQMKDKDMLVLEVGFSHSVEFKAPEGIHLSVEENRVTVTGIHKQLVGNTAAEIRSIKKPEPYKGKGIKYIDEVIRRKAGKTAKSATT